MMRIELAVGSALRPGTAPLSTSRPRRRVYSALTPLTVTTIGGANHLFRSAVIRLYAFNWGERIRILGGF